MSDSVKKEILFMGRYDCEHSKKAFLFLSEIGCNVIPVWSKNRKQHLPEEAEGWSGDYIICFRSYFILPKTLIAKAKIGAINLHPAPPEYPGSGSLNWALYEDTKLFGVTLHLMNELIDSGKILKVKRFNIYPTDDVQSLQARTYNYALNLFYEFVDELFFKFNHQLSKYVEDIIPENWSGKAKKINEVEKISEIPMNIDEKELKRRIRAFHTVKFPLFLNVGGHKFSLKSSTEESFSKK